MATRLADRLSAARHRQFVGRTSEFALFTSALAADSGATRPRRAPSPGSAS